MSNAVSLLKANYCRSIMRTASISNAAEAGRLIFGLTTECRTPDVRADVADAEAASLAIIFSLSDKFAERAAVVGGTEWERASRAIEHWIATATSTD
jgi:hypothetical protein